MRFPSLVVPFARSMAVDVTVDADGIDEDGAPIEGAHWSGKGNYQDKVLEVYDGKRVETDVKAVVYLHQDPFPELSIIAGGSVSVLGETREIKAGSKARNVDGTVNYTRLDLK